MLALVICPKCGEQYFVNFGVEAIERADFFDREAIFTYTVKHIEVKEHHPIEEIIKEARPLVYSLIKRNVPREKIIEEVCIVYGIIKKDAEWLVEQFEDEFLSLLN